MSIHHVMPLEFQKHAEILRKQIGDRLIYAIPKNGLILALIAFQPDQIVQHPAAADVYFDDLVDSGRTIKALWEEHGKKPTYVVFDKRPFQVGSNRPEPLVEPIEFAPDTWINFWFEQSLEHDQEGTVTRFVEQIGDDPTREGLLHTPKRVSKAWKEIFAGYHNGEDGLMSVFENESNGIDQIVGLSDIEFFSTCEHHLLPFYGKASIYYIPDRHITGISKLARVLDHYARRLQNQERITKQVADFLEEKLKPKGVAVVLEASHFCMMARGIGKQHSIMKTSDLRGFFKDKIESRQELFQLIKKP